MLRLWFSARFEPRGEVLATGDAYASFPSFARAGDECGRVVRTPAFVAELHQPLVVAGARSHACTLAQDVC